MCLEYVNRMHNPSRVMSRQGFTYILASTPNGPLHVGATNDILRSIREHRRGENSDSVEQEEATRLVHLERFDHMEEALRREKQLKTWKRDSKLDLIQEYNPQWQDLYVEACRSYGP